MRSSKEGILCFVILSAVLYVLAFREVILHLNNKGILLQGDDMGGFLRDTALLSKYWILQPIHGHKDQLFPSLINIVGSLIFAITGNIVLSYLITTIVLIIMGILGLNMLLKLFKLSLLARYVASIMYVFNPAIAAMFFTGEIHIATTYFVIPYIALLILMPFKIKPLSYKYLIHALILLATIPYIHIAFLLQVLMVMLPALLIYIIIERSSLSTFRINLRSINNLTKLLVSVLSIIFSFIVKYYHMLIHNPFKFGAVYTLDVYLRHSLRNIIEALSLRPSDLSYNYYFTHLLSYHLSCWSTMLLCSLIILVSIHLIRIRRNNREYIEELKILIVALFSILLSIILGLGPNNPAPISKAFEYAFLHYHVFNLLKMGYRFSLVIAFWISLSFSIILDILFKSSKSKELKCKIRNCGMKILLVTLLALVLISTFSTALQGFNKVVEVPNEWEKAIKYMEHIGNNGFFYNVFVVPEFPYTTLVTKSPTHKDVGSLNYLATWIEIQKDKNLVAYSNHYLNAFLLSIPRDKFYPKILIDLLRNINVNYIIVSKRLHPVSRVRGFLTESDKVYQYLTESKNNFFLKVLWRSNETLIAKLNISCKSLICAVNALTVMYPTSYTELAKIISYFPNYPVILAPNNMINGRVLKHIFEYSLNNNITLYVVLSRSSLVPFILSQVHADIVLPQVTYNRIIKSFFIPLYVTNDAIIHVPEERNSLKDEDNYLLVIIPLYMFSKGEITVVLNNKSKSYMLDRSLYWLIIPLRLKENRHNMDISFSSNRLFAIGPVFITCYKELKQLYLFLTREFVKHHNLYLIGIEGTETENVRLLILNFSNNYDALKFSKIFTTIEKALFSNTRAIILPINIRGNISFNKLINRGYIIIDYPRGIQILTLKTIVDLYKGGLVFLLSDKISIIVDKKEDYYLLTLRKRINNSWVPIARHTYKELKSHSLSLTFFVDRVERILKIKINDKMFVESNISITSLSSKPFIYVVIYKGSKVNISKFELVFNGGGKLDIAKFKVIEGIFHKSVFVNHGILGSKVKSSLIPSVVSARSLFSYFYILRSANQNKVLVLYEPYSSAWYSRGCYIMPGLFNSYIVVLPSASNTEVCTIVYKGFLFTDMYLMLILLFVFYSVSCFMQELRYVRMCRRFMQ